MGSDFRRLDGRSRGRYEVYYFLASEFGWDKKQVDRQPAKYIYLLIQISNEQKRKEQSQQRISANQMKGLK